MTDPALLTPPEFNARSLGLTDGPAPEAFDGLTRLAREIFDVPVALISIVEEELDRQFFTSQQGLSEPWASRRQTPLSHSFCQYVKSTQKPLVVTDAREHALVQDNPAIEVLGVVAYLGVPIRKPGGDVIGALCVISGARRAWSACDIARLEDLARCVTDEITLRQAMARLERSRAEERARLQRQRRFSRLNEAIMQAFMIPDLKPEDRFRELLRASCTALGMENGVIARVDGDLARIMFCASGAGYSPAEIAITGSLAEKLQQHTALLAIPDLARSDMVDRRALIQSRPGAYLGLPLVLNGTQYGVLEFTNTRPRDIGWSEEDLSVLTSVSMLACAQLGFFGYIEQLRNSEAALLEHISNRRNPVLMTTGN